MKEHRQKSIPLIEFKKDMVRELLLNKKRPRCHYLKKVQGHGRAPVRRCLGCYASLSKKIGPTLARKQTKQVNTMCSKCEKHYCHECFPKYHKKFIIVNKVVCCWKK